YISSSAEAREVTERSQGMMTRRTMLIGGAAATLAVVGGGVVLTMLLRSHLTTTPHPVTPQARPAPGPKHLIAGVPLLSLVGHTQAVRVARWDPTGRYLATGGEDDIMMLWDIGSNVKSNATGIQSLSTPLRSWKIPSNILASGLCWSANGRTLAAVTGGNKIYLYNAFNSVNTPSIYQDASAANSANAPAYTAIAWSPTSNTFAVPSYMQQQTQQIVDLWRVNHTTGPDHTLTSNATGIARTAIIDDIHPFNATANVNMIGWST